MTATVIPARTPTRASDRQELSTWLLDPAARTSFAPMVEIDWAAPIPGDLYRLSPEWSSLSGTPLWEGLTEEQRVTLTIHEYCSISGVGTQVYASVGLDPAAAKAAARTNEHYRVKLRDASSGLVSLLHEVGLIGGSSELLWKRAGLA